MKENWLSLNKNAKIANETERHADLTGKLGHDSRIEEGSISSEPGETIWKSEDLSDEDHFHLKEQVVAHEESGREHLRDKMKKYGEDAEAHEALQERFSDRIKSFNQTTEKLKILQPQKGKLEEELKEINGKIKSLNSPNPTSVFSREEIERAIGQDQEASRSFKNAKENDALAKTITFGLLKTEQEQKYLDRFAWYMVGNKLVELQQEARKIDLELFALNQEIKNDQDTVYQFLEFLETDEGQEFMKLKDLEERLHQGRKEALNLLHLDSLN